MIFVFDLDDTVCDTDLYSEKYILEYFENFHLPYKKINNIARFAEKKFDWSDETALSWYKENGDQMMLQFPCKDGAIEFINELYDNGHTIVIATARATDWHNEPERITKDWLEKEKIKYHKLYIGRIDKEKICEEMATVLSETEQDQQSAQDAFIRVFHQNGINVNLQMANLFASAYMESYVYNN